MKDNQNKVHQDNQDNVKQVLFPEGVKNVQKDQFIMPTPFIIGFLVLTFIVIKKFIYTPDDKRKDK